ncbi:hypothetical protein F4553_004704 [Allocatelliglobosispora scoriae]|uniref:Uncharacterized protein n=1 Tax=Allocatelliglobosispora scoriae TaxID=643052 RepID=A0A841BUF8_9ACTN|nr:hypothetical protein [Allocatelliglobosispora scoriae]MBB5871325.1 hypothetical protein [Allocatelliglobosispora scoriae]
MPLVAGQLPIFGASSADPSPNDLAGLLIGPGRLVRMGGTARVSVVVSHAWRVHVLMAELGVRQLNPAWEPAQVPGQRREPELQVPDIDAPIEAPRPAQPSQEVDHVDEVEDVLAPDGDSLPERDIREGVVESPAPVPEEPVPDGEHPAPAPEEFTVRTAYTGILAPLSAAWLRETEKVPPEAFVLDGVRLRLWFVAAGSLRLNDSEILLRLGAQDAECWQPAQKALWQLGIDAELAKGPVLKISGRRKIRRFGELIGDHPHAAAPWP